MIVLVDRRTLIKNYGRRRWSFLARVGEIWSSELIRHFLCIAINSRVKCSRDSVSQVFNGFLKYSSYLCACYVTCADAGC